MADQSSPPEMPVFDAEALFIEERFSDLRTGTIRRMNPVQKDGSPDTSRSPRFVGEATVMTDAGTIPLTFRIEANTLEEAMESFSGGVEQAIREMIAEAEEMRRQESSRIVVPGKESRGKIDLP